jgi:UDP-N-acetylmuramyl pentapeptide phosphotransferase/UDP-N-acetylglucosamine-1-phosphate transferase
MSESLTALAGAPFAAFAVAAVAARFLSRGKAASFALDRPNSRSLHQTPVPRTGGIAVLLAMFSCWFAFGAAPRAAAVSAIAVIAVVSFLDDVRDLPAAVRLAVHLAAAAFFVYAVTAPAVPLLAQAALALAIAWIANLYNFMDGSDGLAGGMALIGFSVYAVAAYAAGDGDFAAANLIIAASAAGFLVFNFHPARIFLGDVGSVPLGFLAGSFGVLGWHSAAWPLWFPIVVFSPFIVDSSVTLARRLWNRERVWQAHRDHYYQRLVQMGWGHRRTACAEYALMIAAGGLALLALTLPGWSWLAVLAALATAYAALTAFIEHAWRGRAAADGR